MAIEDYIPLLFENPLTLFRYARMGHHLEKFVEYNDKVEEMFEKPIEEQAKEQVTAEVRAYSKKAVNHGVKVMILSNKLGAPIPNEESFYRTFTDLATLVIAFDSEIRYRKAGVKLNEKVNEIRTQE